MLILTRRVSEAIVIGEDVFITVMGIKGLQVRLGIDAPKNIEVHRKEIYQQIQSGESVYFCKNTECNATFPERFINRSINQEALCPKCNSKMGRKTYDNKC